MRDPKAIRTKKKKNKQIPQDRCSHIWQYMGGCLICTNCGKVESGGPEDDTSMWDDPDYFL